MAMSIELKGFKQSSKKLIAAAAELDYDGMIEAQRKSAKLIVEQAKHVTPKRTGNLANSLQYSAIGQMYSYLPYAGPIHFGWPARGIRENMFLLNTARFLESQWIRYFQEVVDDALKKAAD